MGLGDRFNLDDYVTVNERLDQFRREHPDWGVETALKFEGDAILARAVITDEFGRTISVGHAEEIRGASPVNRTSAVENAETSAVGRALAFAGYEVKRSIASREEMQKASGSEAGETRAGERSSGGSRGSTPGENAPRPGNVRSFPPKPTKEDIARHPANGPLLPPDQAIAVRADELGLSEEERQEIIFGVTDGRTRSGKELRAKERGLVFAAMEAKAKNRA